MELKISLTDEQFNNLLSMVPPSELVKQILEGNQKDKEYESMLNERCDNQNFSIRTENGLILSRIYTLRDLEYMDRCSLSKIRHIGRKSIEEILKLMKEKGIKTKERGLTPANSAMSSAK
jgi:DNA-directed RNA polymerase alpha subunit